jgi:hypothetical protein
VPIAVTPTQLFLSTYFFNADSALGSILEPCSLHDG